MPKLNPSNQTITQYNVQTGAANNLLNEVAPTATSGVPLISQGASSQPVFGVATVPGGGTGDSTLTNHAVLLGQGTSAVAFAAPSTAGYVLTSTGASSNPVFQIPTGIASINVQTFTSSGTYTPTANCLYAYVQLCGGGGGGGGAATTGATTRSTGTGGLGGGYAAKTIYSPTSQTVTIGAAGTGGAPGTNNGTAGGTTSFGAIFSATGGGYGFGGPLLTTFDSNISTNSTFTNACGNGIGGDINGYGGLDSASLQLPPDLSVSGGGGSSFFGSGGKVANSGHGFTDPGYAGVGYGSGGSGCACGINSTQGAGGNGAAGICVITEYIA